MVDFLLSDDDDLRETHNMTNRQKQALETKKKIYDTALRLFKEVGFEKLTINQICKEAGVAVGSFYYYYKSLDFIIIESYKKADHHFKRIKEQNKLKGNTSEKVLQLVGYQTGYAINMGVDLMTNVYKSQINVGNEYFGSWERQLPKIYVEIIQEGQAKREINNEEDAEKIGHDIIIMVRGYIYDWCVHKANYDLMENAKEVVRKYLNHYIK